MLVVIFGAGASFDSVPREDFPADHDPDFWPPLTRDLFANRASFKNVLDRYRECVPLLARLRSSDFKEGFLLERELAELDATAATDPRRKKALLAVQFYIRDVLIECGDKWHQMVSGATNYTALCEEVRHWQHKTGQPVVFITFNYDRLLEQAIGEVFGHEFSQLGHYHLRDDLKLLKLHGSVDWYRVTITESVKNAIGVANYRRSQSPVVSIGNRRHSSRILDHGEVADFDPRVGMSEDYDLDYCAPGIVMPVDGKDWFVCPDDHLEAMRSALADATRVLMVGWRGLEPHFLREWKTAREAPVPVQAIAANQLEALKALDRLREAEIQFTFDVPDVDGFSHYMRSSNWRRLLADGDAPEGFLGANEHPRLVHEAAKRFVLQRDGMWNERDSLPQFLEAYWQTL